VNDDRKLFMLLSDSTLTFSSNY